MNPAVTIRVTDLIGSTLCISAEDGQKVFDKIVPLLKDGTPVVISFERVTELISFFLNAAIGQLYGSFTEDTIRALVKIEGFDADDLTMLKGVEDNAKNYYANPDRYDAAWDAEDDEDEE